MHTLEQQVSLLIRGAEFGDPQLKEMMARELKLRLQESADSGKPLRVYCGYDVTAPDIHLGHTITMRKLRQFQDYGHQVFFVIGTFTSMIGDPSDHDKARPAAEFEKIMRNAATYAEQAFKILDRQQTTVVYNHDWLNQLRFPDIVKLASSFSVQQFLVRDRLHKRIESNEPLWLSELLYPLAQGYDAVHLHSDVQIGGSEQLFNLMAGRKLQEIHGQKPQVCLAFPLLPGLDGKNKMSKSLGNYIGVMEPSESQFGKVMSLPDELIMPYFTLVTRWLPEQVVDLEFQLKKGGIHPMAAKKLLAFEIVSSLNGDAAALKAAALFESVHQQKQLPEEMPEFRMSSALPITDLLVRSGLCSSKSEAKRIIRQKGVKINGITITRIDHLIEPKEAVLQKGRNNFIHLF